LKLLDIVRQHRADMRSKNLEDLTEAELKMKIAEFVLLSEGIVDDPDEQRFVAAAIAIVPHSNVEQILQSLDEIGVSISPERVMELQRDPIFLRLHRPRTCRNDTYSIEELKEYAALAVAAAAAVRSAGPASQRANKLETGRTNILGSDCQKTRNLARSA
jgi:selenocysteine lyase/cysteine desulfurase